MSDSKEKVLAIIFAGGSGARMGAGIPKQFIKIDGSPIILYTLEHFEEHEEVDAIYVACKEDYISKFESIGQRNNLTKVKRVVSGGSSALASVHNALKAAREDYPDDAIVLIHDGVRPHITSELISENIRTVKEHGSAITCTAMFETPIMSNTGELVDEVLPRDQIFTAQAPQSFRLGEILEAYTQAAEGGAKYSGVIDSCTLIKKLGKEVTIVEGNRGNIKVTTPEDLYLLRGLLQYSEARQAFGVTEKEVPKILKK